jgi:hypothetical protein
MKQRRNFFAAVLMFYFLWSPIGHYMDDQIGVGWIIGLQMDRIVVLPIHARVHHEDTGFYCGAFTGLDYHRTDG